MQHTLYIDSVDTLLIHVCTHTQTLCRLIAMRPGNAVSDRVCVCLYDTQNARHAVFVHVW